MDSKISQHITNEPVSMAAPSGSPLDITVTNLIFGEEEGEVIECRMIVSLSPAVYSRVETENLFNLAPDVRGPLFGGTFEPNNDIEIEMALDADVLDSLLEHADDVREAVNYLLKLNQSKKADPLLETESWYGLYVKQQVDLPEDIGEGTLKVGYKTTWAAEPEPQVESSETGKLADIVREFMLDDGWTVYEDDEREGFYTRFEGNNGEWSCYARTREPEEQFIFYSLAPVSVSLDRLLVMAEFLSRANFGLPVGNFELNWDNGEIRYKTSIDVEGAELTGELIRHLIEANVSTMDFYLPGIRAVIDGDSALDAILGVES